MVNYNNLGSGNWYVVIPDFDDLTLKLTKFQIPEVNAGQTSIGNRTEFVLQTSGDHIQFENLSVQFLVDEDLGNYIRLYQWMRHNAHQGIERPASIFCHFLSNDKKFQGIEFEFIESFPLTLSSLELDADANDTQVTCTATFAYTVFDITNKSDRDALYP